jgi:hypothetical protein
LKQLQLNRILRIKVLQAADTVVAVEKARRINPDARGARHEKAVSGNADTASCGRKHAE